MTSNQTRRQITNRDIEILTAIDRTPLTVQQLLKLSTTFEHHPFSHVRSVQDRLCKLREARWIRSWPYAQASRGTAPDYFRLTPAGYSLLYGPNYPVPKKRHFSEIGVAIHHHTRALAEVVVHLHVAAHQNNARLINFYRENSLKLEAAGETIYPDGAFELQTAGGAQFNFVLELDNATETIRSPKDVDSWQRKIRLYHAVQDKVLPKRFRVLVVTTRSSGRLRHILDLSAELSPDKRRSLFYGIDLSTLLAHSDPMRAPCFLDHHLRAVPLIPPDQSHVAIGAKTRREFASLAPIC